MEGVQLTVQTWIWRQISLDVPDDWELLQFSRNPVNGRCAFADRYQYRLELNWRQVEGQPDFGRMLADYRARLELLGMEDTRQVQCAGWPGVSGREEQRVTARYGQHFPSLNCLVEIVFLWPKAQNRDVERAVLSTVRPAPLSALGQARWLAFGMDLQVDTAYEFDHCAAEPAHAHMVFLGEQRRVQVHFRRQGMLSEWLRGSVHQWLEASVPKGYRIERLRTLAAQGHDWVQVAATRRRPVLRDVLFGRREFRAAAWLCPHDERLYSVSTEAPKQRGKRQDRSPATLSCCADMEISL